MDQACRAIGIQDRISVVVSDSVAILEGRCVILAFAKQRVPLSFEFLSACKIRHNTREVLSQKFSTVPTVLLAASI